MPLRTIDGLPARGVEPAVRLLANARNLSAHGAELCRLSKDVLELIPVPKLAPFTKEDGDVVQDAGRTSAAIAKWFAQ